MKAAAFAVFAAKGHEVVCELSQIDKLVSHS